MSLSILAKPNKSAFLGEKITEDITLVLFQFDAAITENFSKTAEITDHPVESGVDITDHIRQLPEEVEIHGWVTNNPIIVLASITVGESPRFRAEDAYEELRRIMDEGQLVKVVTSLREFDNMALRSISVRRDKDTGDVLDATIQLREIKIAETEVTLAPEPTQSNRKKKTSKGKQTPKPTPPPSPSLLAQIFGG
jgi:hypothetical protein